MPVRDAAAYLAAKVAKPPWTGSGTTRGIALKLFESLRRSTVVRDRSAEELGVTPVGVESAIAAAL